MSNLGEYCRTAGGAAMLGALLMIGAGTPAEAAKNVRGYLCDVDERGLGNWAPKKIGFRFNANATKAVVSDPYIDHVHNKPISVSVKTTSGGLRRFRWTLALPTSEGQHTSVAYRVDFDPKTLNGDLIANVAAFTAGRNGGSLRCKAVTFKNL